MIDYREPKETKAFTVPTAAKVMDEAQGVVEHIVAVMGNLDRVGDIIHPGAFSKSLQDRGLKVKVLDHHNTSSALNIVGKPIAIKELTREELPPELLTQFPEATGALWATTQFLVDTPEGAGIFARIKAGACDQYSIGYDPIVADYSTVEKDGVKSSVRNLREIRLWEYSPVVFGANPATNTISAKDAKPADEAKVKPGDDETEDEFMGRCIPAMVEEGREQEQAVAMCASMFEEGTKDDDEEKRKRRRRKLPAAGTGAVHAVVLDSAGKSVDVVQFQGENAWDAIVNHYSLDIVEEGLLLDWLENRHKTDAPIGQKAGRRVRKEKLEEARAAMATLADFLKWADYDESETPDEGDDEKKPKAAAGPDLHPRQKQAMIERLKLELTEV